MIRPALVISTLAVVAAIGCGGRDASIRAGTGGSNGNASGAGASAGAADEGGTQGNPSGNSPAACAGMPPDCDPLACECPTAVPQQVPACVDGQWTCVSPSLGDGGPSGTDPTDAHAFQDATSDASTASDSDGGNDTGNAASGCHSSSDCAGGQVCEWPGVFLGCPGSNACELLALDGTVIDPKSIPGCQGDTECADAGEGFICVSPAPCSCYVNPYCIQGCTGSSQCEEGQVCAAHRCVASPCQTATDCPSNFVCAGSCSRKTCTTDADCNGFCLGGACYDQIGHCMFPVN
jgi:hypothetical protein